MSGERANGGGRANGGDRANSAPSPLDAAANGVRNAPRQHGGRLTTSTGARLADTDHSLKAGPRGPILLADHHLREKITHFDHERIPERVVHARGAAAHGVFIANGAAERLCRADFLRRHVQTPVFVRFSTVLGSRGSADTARDTRGFAVKFYTRQGNYDLVGNNIPVFFIQDGIKFPDVIHAGKPHPDREIPQAQSAHDTFWDFVSLHTEAQHHTIWNMSDRGLPRSYRMMEGFGVHTFRMVDDSGNTSLVKFHWKPLLGVHGMTWEEAQLLAGADPDFHRRDLADAIDAGNFPAWDLGVQVMPDSEDEMFEGIDLLDPTKLVPEELCPIKVIGTLTLTANPTNYFAETEQVAFHVGQLVPGIDVTNDPLLQVRLFSYVDTQLTRLGGPNYNQLPINRPNAPVDDLLRDGMHQQNVHTGLAPYLPNSLDGGCPFRVAEDAVIDVPQQLPASRRVRANPVSFADHHSQAGLFFRSLTPVERDHVIAAYTFELGHCHDVEVRRRQVEQLALIDTQLAAAVAAGLGLSMPEDAPDSIDSDAVSPALSMIAGEWPTTGRTVGVLAGDDGAGLRDALAALHTAGLRPLLIAPIAGTLAGEQVDRSYAAAVSAELDAVLICWPAPPAPDARPSLDAKADGSAGSTDPRVRTLLEQAWRHAKPIAALPEARTVLDDVGIDPAGVGVLVGDSTTAASGLSELLARHRVWERFEPASR